jgi:sulfite oxidase
MSSRIKRMDRRAVLCGGTTAALLAGLDGPRAAAATATTQPAGGAGRPLPAYAAWKDAAALIVHSSATIETRRDALGASVVTPLERLYVRNNLPPPDASIVADRDAWSLSVEGVGRPAILTLPELRSIGLATVPMVLQCSGNGRGFFPGKPPGTPWTVGAAGCVIWSGVPVRAVVAALGGVVRGAGFMTGTGGEPLPAGLDPQSVIVERSVPLAAMADALLAWELNGAPVPLAHGGPLRLVVPGYAGVNSIKYVKRLAFSAQESTARIMSHGYRLSPSGSQGDPSQPSVQQMSVKSWVSFPGPGPVPAGVVQVQGVAFGGTRAVKRVEVSIDGGIRWRKASFVGPDLGRYAWRPFVLPVQLEPGQYRVASRATDAAGNVQPRERLDNAAGYNNTSWLDHLVETTVT